MSAPGEGAAPEEAGRIRRMVQEANAAWTEGRPRDVSPLFHPDVVLLSPDGEVLVEGRDAVVDSFVAYCERATTHAFEEVDHEVRVFGATAVLSYTFEIEYELDGRHHRERGRELLVFARDAEDGWSAVARTQLSAPVEEEEEEPELLVVLDDDPDRREAMTDALATILPDQEVRFFDNAPELVGWLDEHLSRVRLLSLDHDLGASWERDGERFDPGIGRDVVDFLETRSPSCPVVIHSSNGPAADGMLYALRFAEWEAERVTPYRDLAWVGEDWIERIVAHLGGAGGGPVR